MRLLRSLLKPLQKREPATRAPDLIDQLEPIRAARFPGTAPDRFAVLWCAVAEIIGVDVLTMRAEDCVIDLCPNSRWLGFNARIENLEALVLDESRNRPPPLKKMETIGDIIDYLS